MGSPSADKRKAREQAFIILFERSFNSELTIDEILKIAVESEVIEKNKMTADIVRKAEEHIDEIDGVIEKNLKGWSKQRISKVSLALLRMAVCEMKYFDKVPVGVSINEAVEICKVYGSDEDKSFINGILGSIAREKED
ncbi:MAG: transcription antitermination factor NusB [Clostridiaceae bacterium]|nr:transcription antitermination factor NusB [Clostridiaceae bacterium]MDD6704427.1 transcription antitermination factor NusB [Clostridiaceae bacterium]MDD7614964.1 transcription antitermination factor NusB [Clostridiaceae bacterium]MDY5890243.1 transcription antitermination factor NusB [Oscillospiraceae bacterium]